VNYNDQEQTIEVKPHDKTDKGLHLILIELYVKSTKSIQSLAILVKLPISFIDPNLVPFFWPKLQDEVK
jgi:hypothetical protein